MVRSSYIRNIGILIAFWRNSGVCPLPLSCSLFEYSRSILTTFGKLKFPSRMFKNFTNCSFRLNSHSFVMIRVCAKFSIRRHSSWFLLTYDGFLKFSSEARGVFSPSMPFLSLPLICLFVPDDNFCLDEINSVIRAYICCLSLCYSCRYSLFLLTVTVYCRINECYFSFSFAL